ncbi:hypothetical protein OPT61_g3867 [Boeremia exigua]|uniref:Uncharacterized protein n=1 Tax=Boeremia exigua TaxID=749465 RepID=A0ACC2IG57_9PLEO|nr:hypothetical protein OPT61_g3867 [Boeremia exigua]
MRLSSQAHHCHNTRTTPVQRTVSATTAQFCFAMAIFNNLAVELQEAIWELVLPTSRGVHWIEVEGIPQDPEFIRDSIRMTQACGFDRIPETDSDVSYYRRFNPEFEKRYEAAHESSAFFRFLLATVPAASEQSEATSSGNLESEQADEIAFTSRCRRLSTYSQIATLLSLCRLSRLTTLRYIQTNYKYSWPIRRSKGSLYRPRSIEEWETQYNINENSSSPSNPAVSTLHSAWQLLRPRIHTLDLVVLRLHNSRGQATPLLQHGPWQYWIEQSMHGTTFGCFDRIAIEWHPSWGTVGGRGELRPGNVQAIVQQMVRQHSPATLYWLVDGVPRPNWKQDYPAVVRKIFADRVAANRKDVAAHLNTHWQLDQSECKALLSEVCLDQEFEANGRRYYVVFVVSSQFDEREKKQLNKAGLGSRGPFPGSVNMWPQELVEPVRLAYDISQGGYRNLATYKNFSIILSWEAVN